MSPRTPEQYHIIREGRRQEIIEAAFHLFAENGFKSTKISDITTKAGISKGLFYNYFKDKQEVLEEVSKLLFVELGEVVGRVHSYQSGKDNPKVLLREIFNLLKESIQNKTEFWSLYSRLTFQNDANHFMKDILEEETAYNQALAQILEDLGYQNSLIEAIKLNNLLDGVAINYVIRPKIYPLEEMFNHLIKTYTE